MLLTETVGTGAEIDGWGNRRRAGGRPGGCNGRGSYAEMTEKQYSAADVFIYCIYLRKSVNNVACIWLKHFQFLCTY